MHCGRECGYKPQRLRAEYFVTADDVVLLAGKAGVAMTKAVAQEWLVENAGRIEGAIDKFIQEEVVK